MNLFGNKRKHYNDVYILFGGKTKNQAALVGESGVQETLRVFQTSRQVK
jgi:hypothetical protein